MSEKAIDHPNVIWTCAECGIQKETPWGVGLQQEGWLETDNGCVCFEFCPEHNPKRQEANTEKLLQEHIKKIKTTDVSEIRITDPVTGGQKGSKLAKFASIPPDVLFEIATHFGLGEAKYPDDGLTPNWQKGYNWSLSINALHRHLNAWERGEDNDPEMGDSHLISIIWHAMVLRWFSIHNKGTDYRIATGEKNKEKI